ncbi:EscU/YscU/HrcU family type III secretion system export apparatus switch protein [Bacillus marinisedimentorum]|uniref:EscU/YscU/HrcU family type III secretion system export apparatus switch protein n=1 Tax=Bacillus marinisedimentorum TaxID=1821260 RepID=UPI0007E27514|nr:EscU/YscU/HrcU family type III secretion system export apparatus switch protein [Bacillus marinisedimentorum]
MTKDWAKRQAAALSYNAGASDAPKLKAKGSGYVADEIIRRARESNVPIQEDPSLVGLLSQLDINEEIPEELYQAVAEIFAFLYRIDRDDGIGN